VSEKKDEQPKLVEVTLAKPHKHAGISYDTGAKIMVSEPERKWLADQKIIEVGKEPKSQ